MNAPRASLRQRARPATAAELEAVGWLKVLDAADRARAISQISVVRAEPGDLICRYGRPATYWFGVLDGLLKMSNEVSDGPAITFTGLPPGAWFGEGTLLKREPYRYNVMALRTSLVAGLPLDAFHELLGRGIAFNRFLLEQINERLGQFIAARATDRESNPETRVARNLGALFHPLLYPGVGQWLRITQEELGYLVGLSRQRVNRALRTLETEGLIRIEYGGVRVLDLAGLQRYARVKLPARGPTTAA